MERAARPTRARAFDREIVVDAGALSPQVTWGTTPDDGRRRRPTRSPSPQSAGDERALEYMALEPGTPMTDIQLDRVFIGSCTNSRIGDLRAAASMIDGRRVAEGVVAMVVPGSQQVKAQAEAEGLDEVFRAAGFDWRAAGCSMCLGMNPDVAAPGERVASTSNRNFEGRQGRGARSHLVSPQMAAAAADRGALRRHQGVDLMPEPSTIIEGAVTDLPRDDVDTDQIIPARYMKRVERTGLRRVLLPRVARATASTCRPTRSSSPARTSAAARGASTRRGRSTTTASRRSSRRRSPTSSATTARRTACSRSSCRPSSAARSPSAAARGSTSRRRPSTSSRFEIDPEIKHRLLNGLDDISLTLQQEDAIAAYERDRERAGPVTTAL